jgi:quercetin 2,3-dioxygenase
MPKPVPADKKVASVRREVPQHWVGDGFPVRTLFSYHEDAPLTSPFLLLDYGGPHEFTPSSTRRGVGEHPHRGFETVTIVAQGELEHRDSAGNRGTVGPGDVQWMTAASGVVHEEFHSERFTASGGMFEMVQLWVNLPAAHKMSPPRYQEIPASAIPSVSLEGDAGTARVIAGSFRGTKGPATTVTPIDVWELQFNPGHTTTIDLPSGHNVLLVVQRGAITVNESEQVAAVALVQFEQEGTHLTLTANEHTTALLLSGKPIEEPIAGRGPFVMNTTEEIRQAVEDFQRGGMGRLD